MNIPDKYRDRYDRLAASHPWMREMRDEPELTVYNEASDDELFRCSYCHCKVYNIDMTEGDCGWGFTFCPQCGGEVYESDSRKIEAKLGEPTNGIGGETNGIAADAPLVDALEIMRRIDPFYHGAACAQLAHALGDDRLTAGECLHMLVDMIERDYARRDAVNAEIAKLIAKRDEALEIRDKALGDAAMFKYERDEWKAKAESALHENPYVGLVRGKQWERTEISDYYCGRCGWKVTDHDSYCPECGGALHGGPSKVRAGSSSAMRAAAVERLRGSDAVGCLGALKDAFGWESGSSHDDKQWRDALLDLLTDDYGATNLELLYRKDEYLNSFAKLMAMVHGYATDEFTANEWLIAPHEDDRAPYEKPCIIDPSEIETMVANANTEADPPQPAISMNTQCDDNGTCPDGNETCPIHSKAQSKNVPNLSEQPKSLSDLYGILGDEKFPETPDFVENPQKTPEQRQKDDEKAISDNLGKSQDSEIDEPDTVRNELEDNGYVVMPYHNGEKQAKLMGKQFDQLIYDELHDSREKLEADLKTHLYEFGGYCFSSREGHTDNVDTFFDDFVFLLDRQAAITANELIGKPAAPKTAESGEISASKDDIRDFGDSREKLEADCTAAWKSVERIVRSGGMPKERWTNSEFFKLLDRQAAITKAKCEESLASKNLGRLYEPRDNDTREALENDAVLYCDHFTCTHQRFNEAKLIALLDRQAAITERECRHENYAEGDVYRKVYTKSHIDEMIRDAKIELELQRDRNAELQEALDQQRAATANANDLWGRTRDELAAVKAECEAYRSLFGKSLDLADEIRALGADCDTGVAR